MSMDASLPSPPFLEPTHVALALLRLAIRRFEAALTPRVKQWAFETWGDEPQGVAAEERERLKAKHDYVPRWAHLCRECLSENFARDFNKDYLDEWDAYRLGEVIQLHLDAFKPPPARESDAASEIYRNRVHHVGFLRNSLAHPSLGQPSVSECLAGSKAVLEVLRAHGEGVGEAALALPLLQRIAEAEAERRAAPGSPSSVMGEGTPLVVDLTVDLSDEQLRHSVLESALQHTAAALGGAICERWEGAPPPWLKLPMDLAGKPPGGGKSICAALMSHGKELKKKWPAAAAKKASLEPLMGKAGALLAARHDREHGKLDSFDWARVGGLVGDLADAFDSLQLPAGRLLELAAARGGEAAAELDQAFQQLQLSGAHGYLVGRDSLVEEVAARLRDSAHCVAALHGESGAGKTVAAIAVGFATQAELPWQEFMQGSSPLTFRQELARFARTHATGLAADADEVEAVEAARRHFAASSGWLLIVDDIGAGEAALAGVLALLPRGSDGRVAGRVLLTSQRREALPEEVAAWEVGGLSTDESMQLLAAGRPPIGDAILSDEEVGLRRYLEEELSSGQGGAASTQLPLDVALLKSAFVGLQDKKGPDGAVTETALERARGIMRRWRAEPMPSLEGAHDVQKRCVRRRHGAVRELIRRLDECGLEGEMVAAARSLLAMLSVLNADGVPSRLFASREGLGEGSGMGGGSLFGDSGLFASAATALEAVGLVRIEGGDALHMHQLVQRSARHVLTRAPTAEELLPERSLAEWGALRAVLGARFVPRAGEHSHREDVDALQPCVEALHGAGVLSPLWQAALAGGLGGWHNGRGGMAHWEVGEALLREALEASRETLGDNHPDTLTSINNLGMLLEAKGDLDGAEALLREALEARRETLGDRHPRTLTSIYNLGSLLQDKGDLEGAEALKREALEGQRETLGDRHPNTLTSISNLGSLLNAKGDLDGAEALLREALEAMRETLGDRHPNTLTSINNLGQLLNAKGDLEGAEALLREALEAMRETLGDRHPNTLGSINDLGSLLHRKGDLDGAEVLCREALEASRVALGDNHPDTLFSINNLGSLLHRKGDLEGAEALLREALEAQRETLGDRHPNTLTSINDLGSLLNAKSDVDGAETLLREALEARRETLGVLHQNTLTSISNLGSLLNAKGDLGGAEALLREALEAMRETLGDRHPDTLTSISSLGSLLEAKGDLGGAEALLREALEGQRETLGDRHPSTLGSINNLGELLKAKGDLDGAALLLREALEASRETLGDRHPRTLTSISNLGSLLEAKGDLGGAEALLREALEGQRETLGVRHPDTLASINNLGQLLHAKGDLDGAALLLREALEASRETLGDRHPRTLTSIYNLGSLLQDKGDLEGAEALKREALEAQRETLGDRHPSTLKSINNLGTQLLKAKADLDGAEALFREALEAQRETLGDRHPSTLTSISNLGLLLYAKGDLEGAEALLREALEGLRAVLGDNHSNTRSALQSVMACKRALAASRPKQGQNERCACGSGLKFKKCHGKP
ncbi:hypothetical protein EMIHUDRAFT_452118 [Emiliania huxleyi CCMP1516]|uniref:Uncharacterized protein n=2 Tax=Emiliania huxleyi TaxID=2903 RepID=A0A0D3INX2_EMIH1|nr:hypothetical protein EMIHUDRAFT_452118 [Emiliania huxleyi CCMP1516]EOD12957.1 hypothetical protein EMIHUDRAFT_452118 [Emiliania huxleyi CCMP1516]|eukprot:XP_005765386.1 hypothetical protein EMIHUDRAFT_452118 [Emiliania huxleyi CCMP1516]